MRRASFMVVLPLLAATAFAPGALAQDPAALARARERFREGAALMASNDWARALEAFKDVALVKSNANVRFNIATCQEKTGDFVQAAGSYRLALTEAGQANAKDIERAVQAALTALVPKIPTIFVKRGDGAAVAEVTLDGRPLGNSAIGAAFQANPGPHLIKATTPDREPFTVEFTLAESENKIVELRLLPKAKAAPPPPDVKIKPEPLPIEPVAPKGSPTMRIAGFVVGGLGVAGLATSAAFFGLRQKAIADLDSQCGPDKQHCPASAKSTRDSGAMDATVSTATFVAGLGMAAIGGTLILVSSRVGAAPAKPKVGLTITPAWSPSTGGVSVAGRF